MKIYCCGCEENVDANLVTGFDVLPRLLFMRTKNFWRCPHCRNWIGTYDKGRFKDAPLGPIATPKIRDMQTKLRDKISLILCAKKSVPDARKILYDWLSKKLFYPYRTEAIISKEEADRVMELLRIVEDKINQPTEATNAKNL